MLSDHAGSMLSEYVGSMMSECASSMLSEWAGSMLSDHAGSMRCTVHLSDLLPYVIIIPGKTGQGLKGLQHCQGL